MCWFVLDRSASYEELLAGTDMVEKQLFIWKRVISEPKREKAKNDPEGIIDRKDIFAFLMTTTTSYSTWTLTLAIK